MTPSVEAPEHRARGLRLGDGRLGLGPAPTAPGAGCALEVELRLEGEPFHGEADEAGDAEEIAQPPASFTR